jgi:ribosomal protein S18 acetylase RimI-like enzyme
MSEGDRLHEALCATTERLAAVMDDGRFERRGGYDLVSFPTFPLPSFNGVWPEDNAAAKHIEAALQELEATGLPLGVMTRRDRTPAAEDASRSLGLTQEGRIPGMVATAGDIEESVVHELQVLRVETADGFAQSLAIAAAGFEIPAEILAPLYTLDVTGLDGLNVYLARVGGQDVATAINVVEGDAVGIYNVATPPEHRGRGYGGAITRHAARDGFTAGAEFAYLQSSLMGESVYQRLGFREVETYTLFTRPSEVSETS